VNKGRDKDVRDKFSNQTATYLPLQTQIGSTYLIRGEASQLGGVFRGGKKECNKNKTSRTAPEARPVP